MIPSPTPQRPKPTVTHARRILKWVLTALVLGAVAAFFILPLNSCIEGCDCDEEIVEAIVEYGEPDQENRTVEDKQFTAEYIFYDAEIKKTFVWGNGVDICCLESSERYVPGDADDGNGNEPPVAIPNNFTIGLGEILAFTLEGNDPDGDVEDLTFDIQDNVSFGVLTCDSQGECEYEPNTDDETDTFTFTVTDIEGAESDPATVTITIGNPEPEFDPVAEAQVAEAKPGEEIVIELKGVDRSPDSETVVQDVMALGVSVLREGLTYYLETLPEQGQISYPAGVSEADLPYQLSDRFVEYAAPELFTENDSFEFSVSDEEGDVENRSIPKTITIQPAE